MPKIILTKRLPWRPEPKDVLQHRLQDALERVFDSESMRLGSQIGPSFYRLHTFDFEDGMRVIACRMIDVDGKKYVRFCGYLFPDTDLHKQLNVTFNYNHLVSMIPRYFSSIVPMNDVSISAAFVGLGYINGIAPPTTQKEVELYAIPQYTVSTPDDLYDLVCDHFSE